MAGVWASGHISLVQSSHLLIYRGKGNVTYQAAKEAAAPVPNTVISFFQNGSPELVGEVLLQLQV